MYCPVAKPGASGASVLGRDGLLLGVAVERIAGVPHASRTMLSRAVSSGMKFGAMQVRAVSPASIGRVLIADRVRFAQSANTQLSSLHSPVARASTLSVSVLSDGRQRAVWLCRSTHERPRVAAENPRADQGQLQQDSLRRTITCLRRDRRSHPNTSCTACMSAAILHPPMRAHRQLHISKSSRSAIDTIELPASIRVVVHRTSTSAAADFLP